MALLSRFSGTSYDASLSFDEYIQAGEAKQRTLNILSDAVTKKKHLLVENPEDLSEHRLDKDFPLITVSLVQDLITELRKVTFKGDHTKIKEGWIAYVHSPSDERIIYLCPPFWKQSQLLGTNSYPETIIHEVSHFLGYGHTTEEATANGGIKHFQHCKLLPLSVYDIVFAFTRHMNHEGTYVDGSYSCCGERARESVCVKSKMSRHIRFLKRFSGDLKLWNLHSKFERILLSVQK